MSQNSEIYEPGCGETIEAAASKICRLLHTAEKPIEMTFNDIKMVIQPGAMKRLIIAAWQREHWIREVAEQGDEEANALLRKARARQKVARENASSTVYVQ